MGHTVWSQRIATDVLVRELKQYGRMLPEKDRVIYEHLLKIPFKRIGAISYANSMHVWAFLLLSMLLDHEKRIRQNERMADGRVSEGELVNTVDKDA